jgi:transposase
MFRELISNHPVYAILTGLIMGFLSLLVLLPLFMYGMKNKILRPSLDTIFKPKTSTQIHCDKCNEKFSYSKVTNRKCYACAFCGNQIHPLANTIFHKSRTSLKNWFFVIFLFSKSKNGVAAKEIERQLGVTYKCAWRMCKQIRELMADDILSLFGTVEMDETYVGGKEKNQHYNKKTLHAQGRSLKAKIPVIGIVQKGGSIVAKVTTNTSNVAINKLLKKYVPVNSEVHTDEYKGYNNVKRLGYIHKKVNHSKHKFVVKDAHTNTAEGFWSQLKRSVHGTYHAVSPKYLQNYVDEFAFRFNLRKSEKPIFDCIMERI